VVLNRDEAPYRVGREPGCAIQLVDPRASRVHAEVLHERAYGWKVADLDSKNGTHVDGKRLSRARALVGEHRIRCGRTILLFCGPKPALISASVTETDDAHLQLTREDAEVLELLCAPFRDADDPRRTSARWPSNQELADVLYLTEDAIRKRLRRLYARFGVPADLPGERKRRELIAQALERGAVARDAL
jgi:hypothetical protein